MLLQVPRTIFDMSRRVSQMASINADRRGELLCPNDRFCYSLMDGAYFSTSIIHTPLTRSQDAGPVPGPTPATPLTRSEFDTRNSSATAYSRTSSRLRPLRRLLQDRTQSSVETKNLDCTVTEGFRTGNISSDAA